jgi:hypothetical protein
MSRSKFIPRYSGRKESIYFYVRNVSDFITNASQRYRTFYKDKFEIDITNKQDKKTGETQLTLIRIVANEQSESVFQVVETNDTVVCDAVETESSAPPPSPEESDSEDFITLSQSQTLNDDHVSPSVTDSVSISESIQPPLVDVIDNVDDDEILVKAASELQDVNTTAYAAGTELLAISIMTVNSKVVVQGPCMEWFRLIEFSALFPEEIESKVKSSKLPKNSKSKLSTATPNKKLREITDIARQINVERTISKVDDAIVELEQELKLTLLPIAQELRGLRAALSEKEGENSNLAMEVFEMKAMMELQAAEMADMKTFMLNNNEQMKNIIKSTNEKIASTAANTESAIGEITQAVENVKKTLNSCSDKQNHQIITVSRQLSEIVKQIECRPNVTIQRNEEPVVVKEPIVNLNMIGNVGDWMRRSDTLYIGRANESEGLEPSKWLNPFHVRDVGRVRSLKLYEQYVRSEKVLMANIREIEGKQLGCFCKPDSCHGDVLLKLLDEWKKNNAGELRVGDLHTGDLHADVLHAGDRHAADLHAGDLHAGDSDLHASYHTASYTVVPVKQKSIPPPKQRDVNYPASYTDLPARHKSTPPPKQQKITSQTTTTTPSTKKRSIKILMDSNRNNIDFPRVFPGDEVDVKVCGRTYTAKNESNKGFESQPTDIVYHTGTNDIEYNIDARTVAENIMNNAAYQNNQYKCKVYVSLLPPRSDIPFAEKAINTNKWIKHLKQNDSRYGNVKLIEHDNMTMNHLHDKKHLNRVPTNNGWSGSQLLAADIFRAIVGLEAPDHILNMSLEKYPQYGKRNYNNNNKFHAYNNR